MAYTVLQLVTSAFYLSGKYSRDFDSVSGGDAGVGLELLNNLLAVPFCDSAFIPYYQEYTFTAVAGQEKYSIDNLLLAETLTFTIGEVRYKMSPVGREEYFGSGRVNNIDALPFNWHFERRLGGADVYLYFLPDAAYDMVLWGKFALGNVTINQDLETLIDRYYIEYLRYELAGSICDEYKIERVPGLQRRLMELREKMAYVSPPDLRMNKITPYQGQNGLNWGDVNIGKGYRPIGGF